MFTANKASSIVLIMSDENQTYDDFLISSRSEGYSTGVLQKKIDTDFILDLYDKYRDMEAGEVKDTFKETIKIFEKNLGKFLILTQSKE